MSEKEKMSLVIDYILSEKMKSAKDDPKNDVVYDIALKFFRQRLNDGSMSTIRTIKDFATYGNDFYLLDKQDKSDYKDHLSICNKIIYLAREINSYYINKLPNARVI
ncbi:hypothetical protein Bp8pS_249 [Bacillus phage vB_BpuM-BpSp]|nr:hypothetical protein Bp8pS_249 [Bacillus phage vB_BpuM-BpSp]